MSTGTLPQCWGVNWVWIGLWQMGELKGQPLLSSCDGCHVERWPVIARFSDFLGKPEILIFLVNSLDF